MTDFLQGTTGYKQNTVHAIMHPPLDARWPEYKQNTHPHARLHIEGEGGVQPPLQVGVRGSEPKFSL